ncbi:hypothetical protein [Teichococcus vastitatis]|uniref:hypothetical protein n=1 Tax=Teichococcus vastitatis TaxID=2307076 RepID=UPI000E7441F5|nr:hypothetical protein [Pseudoroseomonas vastitatis]
MRMRCIFAVIAMLACTSSTAIAQAPSDEDSRVPPGGGVKADDYSADPDADEDDLGAVTRPDGTPLTAEQRDQLAAMIQRLRAALPQQRNEPEEVYDRRIFDVAYRSLANTWSGRERRQAGIDAMQRSEAARAAQQEERRQALAREEAIAHGPGQENFRSFWHGMPQASWTEQSQDLQAQYSRWCSNNPEPCAREQRRNAAREARAREQEARKMQWQVVHAQRRLCQPLPDWLPGATTPQDALEAIRRQDPDADFDDAAGTAAGRPWVTIETSSEPVLLAKDFFACTQWIRVAFPRG